MPKRMEEVRITAPIPGSCPVCASFHEKTEPHDLNSLYYQNKFFKVYKRFPTWADAMYHCDPHTKAMWTEKLKEAGVTVEFPQEKQG